MVHICMTLFLALAGLSNSQSSDRYLIVKVSDTDEKKVGKIIVTCKENCVLAGNEREKGKKGLLALASERRDA